MNIFVGLMLIFAVIGFVDKTFDLNWGLMKSFDQGLATLGGMVIPMVGICGAGVTFLQNHLDAVMCFFSPLPFDPSMLAGTLLASDMGGYFMAQQLTSNQEMLLLNGVILGALLGQAITFQLPVFRASLQKNDYNIALQGFIVGFILVPVGLIFAGILLKIDIAVLFVQVLPVLIVCLVLAIGLLKFPNQVVRVFSVFSKVIQWSIHILFFITVLGVFVPKWAYVELEAVHEGLEIVFRCAIVICGSLVLSELVLKFFGEKIRGVAEKLGINEVSMMGMILNFSTSLAILPLFHRMDRKGQMMNAAFGVSGSYVLGGQLGFVSSVTDGFPVTVYVIAKVLCGIVSMVIVYRFYERMKRN